MSVGKWPLHIAVIFVTVSLLKRFRNGRFTSKRSETGHLDPEVLIYNSFLRRRRWAWLSYTVEICAKYPGGPTSIKGTDIYSIIVWQATSGRRTPQRAADRRALYCTDGHTCLRLRYNMRYEGREDTEGGQTWGQGRYINTTPSQITSCSFTRGPALNATDI